MNLISIRDIDKNSVEKILDTADMIEKGGKIALNGILTTVFFEPSTRTKMSFQAAALRSGMNYLDFDLENSSVKKGETFTDTLKVVSGYSDVLVIRHPDEGAARLASKITKCPVVNAGDGANQHPSQTLIDLFTIRKFKGRLNGLNVTLFGDLKHGRTMRSLIYGLAMYKTKIDLVCPKGLEMDQNYIDEIKDKFDAHITIKNEPSFENADVLYVCRVQKERFVDSYEAKSVSERFRIRKEDLKNAKEDLIIMNPLPKVNEIDPEIDKMEQAKYFEQARFGVPVRQAILKYVFEGI